MALGFGPTRTQTTLGQPLDFSASVLLEADETVPRECVAAQVFAGDNPVAARHVRAVLEATRDPGQRIVRVTTSIAIDEPVATIEVALGCGSRISRRFVAFIDPPSLRLAEAEVRSETVSLPNSHSELADRRARRHRPPGRRVAAPSACGTTSSGRHARAGARPAPPTVATVSSAAPAPGSKARKQVAATRRNESRTRTALAAPPRVARARLQLDPPRVLVAAQRTLTAAALLAAPAAIAVAAPSAAPASAPVAPARASTDPLLAQVAATAAAAAGASMPAASPAQERMQSLEAEVARMRSESQATQQTVAALRARVRQAEQARFRNVLVYILAATTLLGVLVAALLWWLRPRQRRRARWFDAQANQQARAVARGGPSTSAALASQPAPLSRPAIADAADRQAGDRRRRRCASSPPRPGATGSGSLVPTTQQSSIGGLEVTTVLGPELSASGGSRHSASGGVEPASRRRAHHGRADRPGAAGRVLRRPRPGRGGDVAARDLHRRRRQEPAAVSAAARDPPAPRRPARLRGPAPRASTSASTPTRPTGT